jgi:predicted neuraminidase
MKVLEQKLLPTDSLTVHAATIEFFNNHPVFAWFSGSREGAEDVHLCLYNLHGDGKIIKIGSEDNLPRWNPILFAYNDRLFLFEKVGFFCDRWATFVHDITNWGHVVPEKEIRATGKVLPAGLNGPVKTKPIVHDDIIYCGSSVETIFDWSGFIESYKIKNNEFIFLERSNPLYIKEKFTYVDDVGITRKSLGLIQPSLFIKNNKHNAFLRASRPFGKIFYSYENKAGTWATPQPTNLLNPNSGIDTLVYKDSLYLAYNPSSTKRLPLVISKISQKSDECLFYKVEDEVLIRENANCNGRAFYSELSYPYMIEHNNLFHLVYTYARTAIEYCIIQP